MIRRLLLLYIYSGYITGLIDALVQRPPQEIGGLLRELEGIRQRSYISRLYIVSSVTEVNSTLSLDQQPISGVKPVESACFELNMVPPSDEGVQALQTFHTKVLCAARSRFMDFQDALRLLDPESSPLALLFSEPTDGLKTVPKHLMHFYTYLHHVEWPPFHSFTGQPEVALLPQLWPIGAAAEILKRGCDPAILTAVTTDIVDALKAPADTLPTEADVKALLRLCPQLSISWNRSRYHAHYPATPLMWFALYLCSHNSTASYLLMASGLLGALEGLYGRGFPDARDVTVDAYQRNRQDLCRVVYLILKLFEQTNVVSEYEVDRADKLSVLMHELSQS